MSEAQAMRLSRLRGELMGAQPAGGAMASVPRPAAEVEQALVRWSGRAVIGALNGPARTVVSGDEEAVEALAHELGGSGCGCRTHSTRHG